MNADGESNGGGTLTVVQTARRRHGVALPVTIAAALLVGIAGPVASEQAQGPATHETSRPSRKEGAAGPDPATAAGRKSNASEKGAMSGQQPAQPAPVAPEEPSQPAASEQPLPLNSDQAVAHLGETVDWHRHLTALEQQQPAAADTAARDRLHQQTLAAVKLALDFGKASAKLLNTQTPQTEANSGAASSKGFAGRLDQAAANIDLRINTLQSRLDALSKQMGGARGKERETLLAQKAQVDAALGLAHEVRESVQDMEDFEASSIAGDKGNLSPIDGQIVEIERSVPELRSTRELRGRAGGGGSGANASSGGSAGAGGGAAASGSGSGGSGSNGGSGGGASGSGANATKSGSSNPLRVESAGVIALVGEWFSLSDVRRQLNAAIKETGNLHDEIGGLRGALVTEVRNIVEKDLAIGNSNAVDELLARRAALQEDTSRFKQLSTLLVPLGEQALVVESAAGTLADWRMGLNTRMGAVARYLALRSGILLGWVALVLAISEVWRRATFRYLHDLRRRRQFLVLRRVAVGIALTLVIVFGLISEVGSIATYIGFVTAGIAVAMQNVILAVVAYFFLIGRYGVRVGDRITLSGVTGRVVDVGLVRVYLMELAGADLHATGRMVVLSNAVLFQPTALFKQIPGADYVWHTVTLTIAATADVAQAHQRLKTASEQVYEKYRGAIDRQHATMQRFMEFESSTPRPEIRVRLTENGLECSVRYPVELENAAVIDQQMLKALRDALEHDSQFQLVSTGAVMFKSSDT
jgi:small-conductance mechanosensitive channel